MEHLILKCENCSVRYSVRLSDVGNVGRYVRCSNCTHSWFQEPIEVSIKGFETVKKYMNEHPSIHEQDPDESKKKITTVPDQVDVQRTPLYLKIIPIFLFLLLLGSGALFFYEGLSPYIGGVYSILGVNSSDGIELEDVKMIKRVKGNKMDISLTGNVVNKSDEPKIVPSMRAELYSSSGKKMLALHSKSTGEILEPGEVKSINKKLSKLPKSAKVLAFDIGNNIDMIRRN